MSSVQDQKMPLPEQKTPAALVRYVLLAMVVLSLLFSAVFGSVGIIVSQKIGGQLSDLEHVALTLDIFIQILFALICLLGVHACISKGRKSISFFLSLIIGQLPFSIASGALRLYMLFNTSSSAPWNINECMTVASDEFTRQLCQKTVLLKGFAVSMFIVMWLVEITTIALGNVFLSQIRKEASEKDDAFFKYDINGDDC